jgi:hypothetical protein
MPTIATFFPGARAPVVERGVERDAGTEQRRGDVELDAFRDAQHVVLVDDDLRGVAAVGGLAVVLLRVVGLHLALEAVLLLAGPAVLALAAGVDEAADADGVAHGVAGHVVADRGDDAGDLVAGDHRVDALAPFVAGLVDVGVADSGVPGCR